MPRIILHLDMNSYFASVEQQANPHLRGRPVGVCEHLGGIIIAPSVEAKCLGIKLGTPVWEAIKIYPQISLLPTDPPKYREVTKRFLNVLADYSNEVEQYSIDEAFIDITQVAEKSFDDALLIGLEIKQRIKKEVGEWTSCSVGIGPNKLVAKIAADLDGGAIVTPSSSPPYKGGENYVDRIAVVRSGDIHLLYDKLNLTDVPGIGPRLKYALAKLGIFTLRQLADYPLENLLNQFGIPGYMLHQIANFEDNSPLATDEVYHEKSFGHMYTVPRALTDLSDIKRLIFKLAEKVGRRMRKAGAQGNVIHLFASDKRHQGWNKQRKVREYFDDGQEIYLACLKILAGFMPLKFGLKIVGVSVAGVSYQRRQEPLFEIYKRKESLTRAMDEINNKYGEWSISRARLLGGEDWVKDTVGFG